VLELLDALFGTREPQAAAGLGRPSDPGRITLRFVSDEVGNVEERSRVRWLVPGVVVAAVLAASAAAGWVAWGDRDRSPEALPDDCDPG
jgi:hypothetical protein